MLWRQDREDIKGLKEDTQEEITNLKKVLKEEGNNLEPNELIILQTQIEKEEEFLERIERAEKSENYKYNRELTFEDWMNYSKKAILEHYENEFNCLDDEETETQNTKTMEGLTKEELIKEIMSFYE